ncbi:hypothetical protein [Rhizobium sp. LjRoot254]|uniref:hypothetical protein n=1 Tax=Rhizobium sp. LjRoot254 TaxID=3342297 RepID=UPI003ECF6C96
MTDIADRDRLFEIMRQVSSYEGIQSVLAIHSIVLEAADFCSRRFSLNVMEEVETMIAYEKLPSQTENYCVRSVYLTLIKNARFGYEDPSAPESVRRTIAYGLRTNLTFAGLDDSEILHIFSASLNREPPLLPDIYRDNSFVQAGDLANGCA